MAPRWLRRSNSQARTEAFVGRREDDNICWWCGHRLQQLSTSSSKLIYAG